MLGLFNNCMWAGEAEDRRKNKESCYFAQYAPDFSVMLKYS